MKITSAEFITSATSPGHYPPAQLPEIAFAGRSNVGKSSLINCLANRKRLVKTSSTPGRTRLINFFDINHRIVFVDLPGYGYAKVPEAVRQTWAKMIETFLTGRGVLRGVVLIIDIRRGPGQKEQELIHWLMHQGIRQILVLTKTDKLSKSKQRQQQMQAARDLNLSREGLIVFSAKTRQGREALWHAIAELVPELSG
jgi:GTP-binding protein